MQEIQISIDSEIEKAKIAYNEAILPENKKTQEEIEELEGKLGNLEVIKDDHGSFKITIKRFTGREQSILQEMAIGIRGGVKTNSSGFISNPSIVNSHINSIKFGVKNIEPAIFDFKNDNVIAELDKTLDDWIYGVIDEFNTKNWKFRRTVG